jgi:broad specificity phosphatase PhoE
MSVVRTLLLVRHAEPEVDPTRPSSTWPLSSGGMQAAAALAGEIIRHSSPSVLLVSPELKAAQTAAPLARALGLPVTIEADVREHEAPGYLPRDEFRNAVHDLFARPAEAVFGESANAAAQRLARAVTRAGAESVMVVSHGRVMSAYLAHLTGVSGWQIWRDLTMPDLLRLDLDASGAGAFTRLYSGRP